MQTLQKNYRLCDNNCFCMNASCREELWMSCACPRRPDPCILYVHISFPETFVPFLESHLYKKVLHYFEEEPLGGAGAGFLFTLFSR